MHTHTYTNTHMHTHTYTNTYTHILRQRINLGMLLVSLCLHAAASITPLTLGRCWSMLDTCMFFLFSLSPFLSPLLSSAGYSKCRYMVFSCLSSLAHMCFF